MTAQITARWIADGVVHSDGLESVPEHPVGPVWIDVLEPDEAALAALHERFPLPPLAVEDCLHFPQRPKLDVYPEVTFLVWMLPPAPNDDGAERREIDIFLGEEHLVTAHRGEVEAIDRVAAHAGEYLPRGVEWTLHAILDDAVDAVFPVVETLADELEQLGDLMLADARPDHLQRLHTARRALVALHKTVGPERDVVRGLARLEAFVEPDAYMYFQDIGDHLARVTDQIDTYREVASTTMDIYLSAQSNRMNQIMKTLTVVATIFMPLTLISGIYGMNFRYMPEIEWRYGYFGALGLMGAVALGMVLYFRRRDWW
ncbi:MAG: magnesium/cobalt transporter CorA [Coriobacteriia bacterium]|nr:magnesium/cobalt transporter CorA [Coriobacteriia bacterium]